MNSTLISSSFEWTVVIFCLVEYSLSRVLGSNIFFCPSMLSCCDEMARDQLKGSSHLIKRQSYTSIVEVGSIVHKELQIIMEGVASNTTEVTLQLYYLCIAMHSQYC